jgi:hypothetical protein
MNVEEVIGHLHEGQRRLDAFASVEGSPMSRSYAPGKWSGFQIIAHVADADLVYLCRFQKLVAEEGSPVVPFDQDRWVGELGASERPVALSLALIRAVRSLLIHHLRTLPPESLERSGHHPERGEVTAFAMAETAAHHALHHLEQLDAIRARRTWSPRA